ncbi:MAG TPA: alpha/beta hydrolase [Gammaproteobacteria bacterium]|nr:alpha/beta hydrolase [Gammaproteobacteria bacterium]
MPVVLVHGLWMTGLELTLVARRVRRCGFVPRRFRYRSLGRPVSENAVRLARFVTDLGEPTVHLVGHSLGGLVILRALGEQPQLPAGRVVLLGTPVAGSGVAKRLGATAAGRMLLGRSLQQGLDGAGQIRPTGRQVGVIAGTTGMGVGRLVGGLAQPSDGTVAVAETRLPGAAGCTVAATHMGLVLSREAAQQVCRFLTLGEFADGDRPAE